MFDQLHVCTFRKRKLTYKSHGELSEVSSIESGSSERIGVDNFELETLVGSGYECNSSTRVVGILEGKIDEVNESAAVHHQAGFVDAPSSQSVHQSSPLSSQTTPALRSHSVTIRTFAGRATRLNPKARQKLVQTGRNASEGYL